MPMNRAGITILIDHFSGLGARLAFLFATVIELDMQIVDNAVAVGEPGCRRKYFGNKLACLPPQKPRSSHRRIVNASEFPSHCDRWAEVLNFPRHLVQSS